MCGCATRSVAPKRGAAGAGPADGRASAATASWAAPPLGIFRVAPHVLHEQRVRLRWPSNAISRLCGSNNRRYGAVPNAQIVILACPTHGRSAVPTSSNRGSRLRCSCDVAPALHATMSLGAAGAVRARSADRAGRLPSMLLASSADRGGRLLGQNSRAARGMSPCAERSLVPTSCWQRCCVCARADEWWQRR